jgi:uncharacterized protein (DUF488 family)
MGVEVYTLGYGGLGTADFVELLRSLGIEVVVDVRRWCTSRRVPEFSGEALSSLLSSLGIRYTWIPELGGYRRFGVDVEDLGIGRCFRSEGFRAYATYILHSPVAREALARLEELCRSYRALLLCREGVPARCHRKILSDWLLFRGFRVLHVVPPKVIEHRFTRCARVVSGELTYI